jgi:hypothetical protein
MRYIEKNPPNLQLNQVEIAKIAKSFEELHHVIDYFYVLFQDCTKSKLKHASVVFKFYDESMLDLSTISDKCKSEWKLFDQQEFFYRGKDEIWWYIPTLYDNYLFYLKGKHPMQRLFPPYLVCDVFGPNNNFIAICEDCTSIRYIPKTRTDIPFDCSCPEKYANIKKCPHTIERAATIINKMNLLDAKPVIAAELKPAVDIFNLLDVKPVIAAEVKPAVDIFNLLDIMPSGFTNNNGLK